MNIDEITDVEVLQKIGGKLKELRLEQNIKQKELAEKSGLSMFSVSQIETGHNTSVQSVIQVLRALGRMDMLEPFINSKAVASLVADRQRVSRVAPLQQHKPVTYSIPEFEGYTMAAEEDPSRTSSLPDIN